jgi:formylglycine-generating enzyme
VLPAGYLSRTSAERACQEAGKRLCARGEWVRACRGQEDRPFPYGPDYRADVCNVHRKTHPARLLHGNSSEYHTDPRLGLTEDQEGPLLRRTGQTPACVSQWGTDGIHDMVGNLDEWIDDPDGTFVGGFYSRATKEGCNSVIDVHAPAYFDYSLGTRCCSDPGSGTGP